MSEQDTRKLVYYAVPTIDLSVGHTDLEIDLPGIFDTLIVSSISGSASVRLNEITRDLIDLTAIQVIHASAISKLFLTNTAQANGSLVLLAGSDSSFQVGAAVAGVRPARFNYSAVGYLAAPQVSTNAYVMMGTPNYFLSSVIAVDKATIVLTESGGQNVKYQIQATLDGTNWIILKTDQALPKNTSVYETITDLWYQIAVYIIDNVGGVHGAVAGRILYKNLL